MQAKSFFRREMHENLIPNPVRRLKQYGPTRRSPPMPGSKYTFIVDSLPGIHAKSSVAEFTTKNHK
ncbi:MAG TPA: hypothetical protein VH024_02805 [Candidatus Angelobacter sp.]|nr:hypothetical protein [Candidatus Angelobacter sp.]